MRETRVRLRALVAALTTALVFSACAGAAPDEPPLDTEVAAVAYAAEPAAEPIAPVSGTNRQIKVAADPAVRAAFDRLLGFLVKFLKDRATGLVRQ